MLAIVSTIRSTAPKQHEIRLAHERAPRGAAEFELPDTPVEM